MSKNYKRFHPNNRVTHFKQQNGKLAKKGGGWVLSKKSLLQVKDGLLDNVRIKLSPNHDNRPDKTDISLIVIHNISLPPNDFGGEGIDQLFSNTLDKTEHPFYKEIHKLRVSSHLLIRRNGEIVQYVPFHKRAWHAGISEFLGQDVCNDFSIGIEMEGTDFEPFMDSQYQSLLLVIKSLLAHYPSLSSNAITGHEHISPGRKTDPGPYFDWEKLSTAFQVNLPAKGCSMTKTTIIDLLRHGEPEGGTMYRGGGTDHPLSEAGWAQMKQSVQKNSADWSAIVSSPMLRCKDFGNYLADQKNLPIEIIENLREAGYGSWEGRTSDEIRADSEQEYWQFIADPVNSRPKNAEPLDAFTQRIKEALLQILDRYEGQHILLVAHTAVNRAILGIILDFPLASQQLIEIPFAGMIRLTQDRKGLRMHILS